MARPRPAEELNPTLGIAFKIGSIFAFMGMLIGIKMAGQVPAGQIVFFRSFFATVPILVWLVAAGQLSGAFATKRPGGPLIRGLIGVTAMGLGFSALIRLPLPDAVAIGYAQPPLVVMLGALVLGETVRIYRWSAVVVGLVGVAIISWPKLTVLTGAAPLSDDQALGVLFGLAAATCGAFAMIFTRGLVTTERTATIVIFFSLTCSAVALLTIPFGWAALSPAQAAWLVFAGIMGGIGQVGLTQSYRYADTSTVAPFEYTSLILSVIVGYLLFAETPTSATLIGGAIVIASGLFIIYRERQLGLERRKERQVAKPKY